MHPTPSTFTVWLIWEGKAISTFLSLSLSQKKHQNIEKKLNRIRET
jgi:hypothetical protein